MPKLTVIEKDYTCFLCGSQAFYISYNSKKMRCVEKITKCPGFIAKAEKTKQLRYSPEKRREHMKKMSINGNDKLKKLHNNPEWLEAKKSRISSKVKSRGGHLGDKNPMYGKKQSDDTRMKQSSKAKNRDPRCYVEGIKTKILRGIVLPREQKNAWQLYKDEVYRVTYYSWKSHHQIINPCGLERGVYYELDHKFSILEGYKEKVPPEIIGHYINLEVITKTANRKKSSKCSISIEDLFLLYDSSTIDDV